MQATKGFMSTLPNGLSTSRDRTKEFSSAVESFNSRRYHSSSYYTQHPKKYPTRESLLSCSAYIKQICKDLSSTNLKLEKLALISDQKHSLSSASQNEKNVLTNFINHDVSTMNKQIGDLQEFLKHSKSEFVSVQQYNHFTKIVLTLQAKLANLSNQFKSVLEIEKNFQRSLFKVPKSSPKPSRIPNSPSQERFQSSSHPQSNGNVTISMDGSAETHEPYPSRSHQQQQLYVQDEQELRQRDTSMQNIEQTIVQLGDIFNQLTYMVKEQEEVTNRIDYNVDISSLNVEEGHSQLARYLKSISGTRGLMIKFFIVLFALFVIFVLFLS